MRVTDETEGKYYATDLSVTLDDGRTVWIEVSSDDPEPSYVERQDPDFEICDGHYEREATRIVVDAIIERLSE